MKVSYRLRDRDLLQKLMEHPGCGTKYSIRTLAKAAKTSTASIGHLLSGHVDSIDVLVAHSIAEAIGVAVLVLFEPPVSPNQIDSIVSGDETEVA